MGDRVRMGFHCALSLCAVARDEAAHPCASPLGEEESMNKKLLQITTGFLGIVPLVTGVLSMFGVKDPVYASAGIAAFPLLDSNLRFFGGVWLGLGIALAATTSAGRLLCTPPHSSPKSPLRDSAPRAVTGLQSSSPETVMKYSPTRTSSNTGSDIVKTDENTTFDGARMAAAFVRGG